MKWKSAPSETEVRMKKRNIVLIGPMGTGKSRAAKILADGFDWQLADTDRMMERETGNADCRTFITAQQAPKPLKKRKWR